MKFLLNLSAFLQLAVPVALAGIVGWALVNTFSTMPKSTSTSTQSETSTTSPLEFDREPPPILGQATEISAEDVDGVRMKLSEFRGQVVMLDFWGFWCPHCVAMFDSNRHLVETMKGKPFVLLGVNSDSDREKTKAAIKKRNVTWRSWWNGGSPRGSIAQRWQVSSWPAVFLIDHKGNVRYDIEIGPNAHRAIERGVNTLLRELEQEESK